MGYTVSFFSYATKRKSCEFARISSIIVRISLSVGIKKDSVESISAIYAVFRLCNAHKVLFSCFFQITSLCDVCIKGFPFLSVWDEKTVNRVKENAGVFHWNTPAGADVLNQPKFHLRIRLMAHIFPRTFANIVPL